MLKRIELDNRAIEISMEEGCSLDEAYEKARAELDSGSPKWFDKIFGAIFRRKK